MSYWVYLVDGQGKSVKVDRHCEGGTYAVGGITEAELNVTYNYGEWYWKPEILGEGGLKSLDGKKADDVIERLENAVRRLGTERNPDYWKPTKGNAGYAFNILLKWARQHPNAVFMIH